MPFADVNQTQLHYLSQGPSDGRPLLLMAHSLGASAPMWQPQAEALAQQWRVVRYDLRGHGQSEVPLSPVSAEILGRDALALMDSLGAATAAFCGLSLGGSVGQWLGIHAAERLTHLVLANTAARIGTPDNWNTRIALVEREGLTPVIDGTLERWFTADFRAQNADVVATTRRQLEATDPRGYTACCAAVRDADFRTEAAAIRVPTLVIGGSHDPVTTPADTQWLAAEIPGARYMELPAAHLSSVECEHQFSHALAEFLAT